VLTDLDIPAIRAQFPLLSEVTYLEHSAVGPLSAPVRQAAAEALAMQAEGSRGVPRLQAEVPVLKEKIARLIGASPQEIALVRNTAEGLSTVAGGVRWREGDCVVTDNIEFPANVYPWLNLESRFGVTTALVPAREGRVRVEDLLNACQAQTRLVAVSFVQFSNGYRIDLERLGAFCRERGILLCVDGIQGLGALPLDVSSTPVDFLACGGHKWLLGPLGLGFLYLRRELQAQLWPIEVGHHSVVQDEERYTSYNLTFRDSAEKFEASAPNYAGVFGLSRSLDLFHAVGQAAITERIFGLTDRLCEGLAAAGCRVLSPRAPQERSGAVTFTNPRRDSKHVHERLRDERIIVSLREGAIRVSPHFYNTAEEIDRLVAAVRTL
jgi:cysteine desulfurase / selenocysteine lyase